MDVTGPSQCEIRKSGVKRGELSDESGSGKRQCVDLSTDNRDGEQVGGQILRERRNGQDGLLGLWI